MTEDELIGRTIRARAISKDERSERISRVFQTIAWTLSTVVFAGYTIPNYFVKG